MRPRKPTTILILLALLAMFLSCKKDNDGITIQGFLMVDAAGNVFGEHGSADGDWDFRSTLSSREMALFDFPLSNPADINGTSEGTVSASMAVYPNPFVNNQSFELQSSTPVVLRIVIADRNLKVFHKISEKFENIHALTISLDDTALPPGTYRVYFSVSAEGKPNFKVGYGDIGKCKPNTTDAHDCF